MVTVSGHGRIRGVKRTLVELSEKLGSVKFTKFCKILFAPLLFNGSDPMFWL
jgi:hypothetical protein